MARIGRKTKRRYRDTIRDVIKKLSRKVQVYKQPVKSECPNCYYDKMTASSTGKCKWTAAEALAQNDPTRFKYFQFGRCPICNGKGYLETQRKVWVDCLVVWDPAQRGTGNQMIYTPAGTEGSTVVQLKSHPKNFDTFKNCSKIVIDGVECKLSRPPMLRGLGNQSILLISAFTTEKPKIDTDEIIKDYT